MHLNTRERPQNCYQNQKPRGGGNRGGKYRKKIWEMNFYWNEKEKKEQDQKYTNMPESGVVRSLTVSKGETGLYYNVSLCREKRLSVFRAGHANVIKRAIQINRALLLNSWGYTTMCTAIINSPWFEKCSLFFNCHQNAYYYLQLLSP